MKFKSPIVLVVFFFFFCSPAVNGKQNPTAPAIVEKYKVGKVIGDGNFAVVKECVERYAMKQCSERTSKMHFLFQLRLKCCKTFGSFLACGKRLPLNGDKTVTFILFIFRLMSDV